MYLCFQSRWTAAKVPLLLLLTSVLTPFIRLCSAVLWKLGVRDGKAAVCLDRC